MRLRKALRNLHRWAGLLSAVWLLLLAFTGLLLQHADRFGLSQMHVTSAATLQWFGYGQRQLAWDFGDETFYQLDDVISFQTAQSHSAAPVVAVAKWKNQWVVATEGSLRWLNELGETIDQLDDFDGLPTPIAQMTVNDDQLLILVQDQWYQQTQTGFQLHQPQPKSTVIEPRALTGAEKTALFSELLGDKLSYDKVLHGIHAGIQGSVWLNTLSALALFFLCFSGIYLFFKKPKRKC